MIVMSRFTKGASFIFILLLVAVVSFLLGQKIDLSSSNSLISPFISQEKEEPLTLLPYTIPNLAHYPYQASPEVTLEKILSKTESYTSYLFFYTTGGKKISGQINIPAPNIGGVLDDPLPSIILIRGWVAPENYQTGVGTKNAAASFASQGYITVSPDFLGYGESDPEPEDSWESRFVKPIQVIELIQTLQTHPKISFQSLPELDKKSVPASLSDVTLDPKRIGMWAHSNGGQIALTSLEVLSQTNPSAPPIPTTLWAPVTAPFPYSLLFFSDENEDEGKTARKWISLFEENYDAFDFSLTQHLDRLTGPLQLHHGTADEAALMAWSDEFIQKIELENKRRLNAKLLSPEQDASKTATSTENSAPELTEPIDLTYFTYPNADHNLQPGWNTAIQRDIAFFDTFLR